MSGSSGIPDSLQVPDARGGRSRDAGPRTRDLGQRTREPWIPDLLHWNPKIGLPWGIRIMYIICMPHVAEAPDPFAGTAVGRHRLRERIGAGPHATVYLASPPSGNEPLLAFKLFSPEASADPEFSARCYDAAEASRRITHPGVVKVLEVGRHESRGYILMEHVPAGSLEKLLESERRLSFDRATRIVRDVALALEAARAAGQFHLNLRPANILLGSDG